MVAHGCGEEAHAVASESARGAEAAAEAAHAEAVRVDLQPEAPAEMLADDLVDPTWGARACFRNGSEKSSPRSSAP